MASSLWVSNEAERATGGETKNRWQATGVSIDTRTLKKGDLFVAIKGEHFDGHRFAAKALAAGAAGVVVSEMPTDVDKKAPLLVVDNTQEALRDLGGYSRGRMTGKVIAVTGSVGKTSTKEMLKEVLAGLGSVYATEGNYNNHIGLPLSLARMDKDTAFGVFEIGMNHAGEIRSLSKLARPHVAIITTVEPVHLEFFPSVEAIADAKAEIFEGMDERSIAVLNKDNAHYTRLKNCADERGIARVISFGKDQDADVRLVSYTSHATGSTIKASIEGKTLSYKLGMIGKHQALNSLAVVAAVYAMDPTIDLQKALRPLATLTAKEGRGKRHQVACAGGGTYTLLDDSYNASPASVVAALSHLASLKAESKKGRTIAVLGDMYELGTNENAMHIELAEPIVKNHIDLVFTVGDLMMHLQERLPKHIRGGHSKTSEEIIPLLFKEIKADDSVLIKGSHGVRMDTIIHALTNR